LPVHVLGSIAPGQQRTSGFGQHPVGTGPYVLAQWRHDEVVTLERNPRWWHALPHIARIQFRIVTNPDARVDAMADGSADLYDGMGVADYRTLRTIAPSLNYLQIPDLYSYFIYCNDTLPGLNDVAVRRAMMYGWDRTDLATNLEHGGAIVNDTITAWALTAWHDSRTVHYPYDPAQAESMLDRAGWRRGSDGVRQRGNVRLAYTLKVPIGGTNAVAVEFQADMRAIGISVDVQMLDYPTFIDQTNAMNYQLAFSGWGGTPDPDEYTFLDSSQIVPVGNNQTAYRNPAVDRDLRAGLRTFDLAKRRAIYDDLQRRVAADVPVLWGFDVKYDAAWSKRLVIDRRQALPDLYLWWNVYDWRLSP
jgi:peptide/nickel transport system substrate-binding protein